MIQDMDFAVKLNHNYWNTSIELKMMLMLIKFWSILFNDIKKKTWRPPFTHKKEEERHMTWWKTSKQTSRHSTWRFNKQ
jgi:hypothetical protein